MKNANNFRSSSFWVGTLAILGLFLLALPNSGLLAAPAKRNVSFDHIKTGFPLTGAHVTLPCETCHVQGTFKGTPKKCETCHTRGSRIQTTTFKANNHIATTQACDQCHRSTASWNVVMFSHVGVVPHQCAQCHNGTIVMGKPANHAPTTSPCDTCHRTTTWMSVGFNHVSVTPGSCATCHVPGGSGMAKPSNHIPTTLSCDACHNTSTYMTSTFTHSGAQGVLPGQCSTCHNGSYTQWNALGKTPTHVATSASCDTCHTGYVTFAGTAGSTFNHAGVSPGTCATCHGVTATGKPSNHVPTILSCDACHTMGGTFATSTFTHSATQGVVAGQCLTCHNGSYTAWNALAKPSNHIPTSASCEACHATGGTFTTSTFTHSVTQGVLPGQCASSGCHSGAYTAWNALGQPAGHVVTTASCDSCHTSGYSTFAGAGFNHTGVAPGSCATCHVQGGSGMAKPTNHIPTTVSCDACHNTTTFATSTFSHSTTQGVLPGQCATSGCHSGAYTAWNALGKPSGHVATTASCDSCHAGFTTFANGVFNHTGIAPGTCSTCHTPGGSGLAAPTNHIPYASQLLAGSSMNCDACHSSTTSFTVEKMNHNGSQGNGAGWCKGCHQSGTSFLGNMQKMSLTHQKSTGVTDCSQSGCHRPLGNTGNTYTNWN